MNLKIVCVGCSFTDGLVGNLSHTDTYPYQLSLLIPNSIVYNLGVGAASNFFAYQVIKTAIEKIKPDIIIRQLTRDARFHVYNHDIEKLDITNYITQLTDNYFFVDRPKLLQDSNFFTISTSTGKLYNLKLANTIHRYYFKYFHNQDIYELNKAVLLAGDHYLKDQRSLTFSWMTRDTYNDFWSVEDTIGFNKKYCYDTANHFNKTGNEQVAKYVFKHLIDKKYVQI